MTFVPETPEQMLARMRATLPSNPILIKDDGTLDYAAIVAALGNFRGIPEVLADWICEGTGGDWFPSKVVGVSKRNDDGTSRQAAIKKISDGEFLSLEPDPDNPFDPNAIKVVGGDDDRQIGFLGSRLAGETARAMKRGTRYLCMVLHVTGEDMDTRGVNIAMIRWYPKK